MTTTTERLTPASLSYLIYQHSPRAADPCGVCGADMAISQMENRVVTYNCRTASPTGEKAEHWRRSQQIIAYHGDSRVVTALHELRALREAAGEDMIVPAGEQHFPHGHGKYQCCYLAEHQGEDRWAERFDNDFTHDPTHADLRHS